MSVCCVPNCRNTSRNSPHLRFYAFPAARDKVEQRAKWIEAVNKKRRDGAEWKPTSSTRLCSAHFVGNSKSKFHLSPSYVPTIFPLRNIDEATFSCKLERIRQKKAEKLQESMAPVIPVCLVKSEINLEDLDIVSSNNDKETQVDFSHRANENSVTITTNRFTYNGICEVECQTDIKIDKKSWNFCSIVKKENENDEYDENSQEACVGMDFHEILPAHEGFDSNIFLRDYEQLLHLSGIPLEIFNFLLKLLPEGPEGTASNETRLLIFLTKLKTGLSDTIVGELFRIPRMKVTHLFSSVLYQLASACNEFVEWPDSKGVPDDTSEFYKKNDRGYRVIIDYVYIHASNSKDFARKHLIASSPSNVVTFVSKSFDSATNDSELIMQCGILERLDPADLILADKAYEGVKASLENRKKDPLEEVSNPRLEQLCGNGSDEDVVNNYLTASQTKISAKRAINKIKMFRILDGLPVDLLRHCNKIVFVCCALVNLQTTMNELLQSVNED